MNLRAEAISTGQFQATKPNNSWRGWMCVYNELGTTTHCSRCKKHRERNKSRKKRARRTR
jgi:hypothetical protein